MSVRNRKQITWQVNPDTGCWICTSHYPNSHGYPRARRDGKGRKVARIMYERYKGEIPAGMWLLHTCDNRACINPAHLYAGTPAQNMRDMVRRGRDRNGGLCGESHGRAKLREAEVLAIRASTASHAQLARQYGVSWSAIHDVKKGRRWRHLLDGVAGCAIEV